MNKKQIWFLVALVAAVMATPNGMVVRILTTHTDPNFVNFVRFGLVGLVFLPYLVRDLPRLRKKALARTLVASLALLAAGVSYCQAMSHAPASYAGIIGLLAPIVLMVYASRIGKEKIHHRAMAGVALAALGAFAIAGWPLVSTSTSSVVFYPYAIAMMCISTLAYPLSIVVTKRVNRLHRIHLLSIISFSSLVTALGSALIWLVTGSRTLPTLTEQDLLLYVFAGLGVLGLSRYLTFLSYRHLNTSVLGSLWYVESLLSILLPVVFLGEFLTKEMIIGGLLILAGVYIVERHHPHHTKHRHMLRSH